MLALESTLQQVFRVEERSRACWSCSHETCGRAELALLCREHRERPRDVRLAPGLKCDGWVLDSFLLHACSKWTSEWSHTNLQQIVIGILLALDPARRRRLPILFPGSIIRWITALLSTINKRNRRGMRPLMRSHPRVDHRSSELLLQEAILVVRRCTAFAARLSFTDQWLGAPFPGRKGADHPPLVVRGRLGLPRLGVFGVGA